jgi:hypothetical protein
MKPGLQRLPSVTVIALEGNLNESRAETGTGSLPDNRFGYAVLLWSLEQLFPTICGKSGLGTYHVKNIKIILVAAATVIVPNVFCMPLPESSGTDLCKTFRCARSLVISL